MFSYLNKVVGIKAARPSGSGAIDLLINNAYVGSITGTGQGDSAYFIGSDNTSLSLEGVSGSPTGYVYYFSDLLLNTGINELCSSNDIGNAAITGLEIDLYDLSGSTLVNPIPVPATNFLTITGNFTWTGANADAISRGGRLAVLNTFRKSNIPRRTRPLWIGATDTGVEGTWRWVDGSLLNDGYTNWASGEPNNYANEDYAISYGNAGPNWPDNIWNDIGAGAIVGGYLLEKPDNFCYVFDLRYPNNRSVPLTETPPILNVNTGNLNQVFTGRGVHLKKDVTFFFDILDQQLNAVSSNQQFLENPLIGECVFDILNANGTTAAANFSTGKYSRSVTVSALDNENVFGSYRKDFGVRCKLPNTFDGSVFTGEFYVSGNVPNILDIAPDYTEFSGEAKATELINVAVVLQNDLNFTQMDRYDVYALTGSGSAVNKLTYLNPFQQEGYLFSQSAADVANARSLTINRGALAQDVPHYFTVVPYGALGSGSPFMFGPATFVTVDNIVNFPEANASALNLYDGNSFGQTIYKTGKFFSDTGILHEFSSGQFSSVKYFIEIFGSGQRRLSDLKGVINTTGLVLTKKPVNDTTTQYQLTGFASGLCGLFASGSGYANYLYELQATTI